MKIILLLLSLASVAQAGSTVQTRARYTVLIEELRASGATNIASDCKSDPCTLSWDEPKSGPFVFEDTLAIETKMRSELKAIDDNLVLGVASSAEVQKALHIVIKLLIGKL